MRVLVNSNIETLEISDLTTRCEFTQDLIGAGDSDYIIMQSNISKLLEDFNK